MEIVDASNTILGRLATQVAKKLLSGEEVVIVNAEKAVISGKKEFIIKKYIERRRRGTPQHGPFFPSRSDMIVRRTIRNMLPHKTQRGRDALKKLKVFISVPEEFKTSETKKIGKQAKKLKCDYLYIEELSKFLGYNHHE
jgi:large subunit ribosomal protein L13